MSSYYIWTVGCQMNEADSRRLAEELERLGYRPAAALGQADVVVLNSCVVRQSAEERVLNKVASLRGLKAERPFTTIALMGCMVGDDGAELRRRFPHVDLLLRPQEFQPLLEYVPRPTETPAQAWRGAPLGVTAYVNVIHGCNKFCTYCIVPLRRGREVSRPLEEVFAEVEGLVRQGVREVTLLGQTVNSYGRDLPEGGSPPRRPTLAGLLARLNEIAGLWRTRFLTCYPPDMDAELIEAVASLDKVCEHINIPFQAGSDRVLRRMGRRYTRCQFLELMERLKAAVPGVSLSTDVIVGFPRESEGDFRQTLEVLREVEFDVVHVAMYSPRPGTASARLPDDVPAEEKRRRLHLVESFQEELALRNNRALLGKHEEVLVERLRGGKWEGRTRSNKPAFFCAPGQWVGRKATIEVSSASAWSLQGSLVGDAEEHD